MLFKNPLLFDDCTREKITSPKCQILEFFTFNFLSGEWNGVFWKPEYDVFVQYFLKTTADDEGDLVGLYYLINVQLRLFSIITNFTLTLFISWHRKNILAKKIGGIRVPKGTLERYMHVN